MAQAAKTYLEKHLAEFATASADELIKHGLKALASTLQARTVRLGLHRLHGLWVVHCSCADLQPFSNFVFA